MSVVFSVGYYEIRVLLRDARTGLVSLLGALVLGGVWNLAGSLQSSVLLGGSLTHADIELPVAGSQGLPQDIGSFLGARGIRLVRSDDELGSAVASARLGYGLLISRNESGGVRAELLSNAAHGFAPGTQAAIEKIRLALDEYAVRSLRAQLAQRGDSLDGIALVSTGATVLSQPEAPAAKARDALYTLHLLLFVALIWACNASAMAIASEHEAQTLESLLMTPARQMQIVIGKSLSTCFSALIAVLCALVGAWLSGTVQGVIDGTPYASSLGRGVLAALCCSPLLYTFSLVLVVACYRKTSYQGAITQASLLGLLLFLVCSVALAFAPAAAHHYALPVYGSVWFAFDVLRGAGATPATALLAAIGDLPLCAAALFAFYALVPARETLLYGR
jgi:ABC-type Na+ efflux pump permease subunit